MAAHHATHEHGRDLLVVAVDERIADLRAIARVARHPAPAERRPIVARLRDALGRRLIAVGSALVADEALRRRPALRP